MLVMFRTMTASEDIWVNPYYVQQVRLRKKHGKSLEGSTLYFQGENGGIDVTESIDKVVRKLHLGMGYKLPDPEVGGVV